MSVVELTPENIAEKQELDTAKEEPDTTKQEIDTAKKEPDTTKQEIGTAKEERDAKLSDFRDRMFSMESYLVSCLKELSWSEDEYYKQSDRIEKEYGLKRSGPNAFFTEFSLDKFGVNDINVFLERLNIDNEEFDNEISRRNEKGPEISPFMRNYRINGNDVYSRDKTLVISFLHMYYEPGSKSPSPGKYFHYFGVSGELASASRAFDACLDSELSFCDEYSFGGRDFM